MICVRSRALDPELGISKWQRLAWVSGIFLPVIHTLVSKVWFMGLPPDIHRAYT
jgi:hypothetical protein